MVDCKIKENNRISRDDLSERLLNFAVNIIKLVNLLPKTVVGKHIGNQLMRSGTSPGGWMHRRHDSRPGLRGVFSYPRGRSGAGTCGGPSWRPPCTGPQDPRPCIHGLYL